MKGKRRTPLWLICDVPACLRLHLALGVLLWAVRRFLPRHSRTPPGPEGIVWLTAWQAGCERLLRWVIARHALRLCGLDPSLAYSSEVAEAANSLSWRARSRALVHMYRNMTAIARRWARRIRHAQSGSVEFSRPDFPNPDPSNFSLSPNPATTIFSVAIRGPPQLTPDCPLPTAHCLLAHASEAANVCAPGYSSIAA